MKSVKNLKRIYDGNIYISISLSEAIQAQKIDINLKQFHNLKSIFIAEQDYIRLKEATYCKQY